MVHKVSQVNAAAASFFPTTQELACGIKWFKEHPVMATAAATAVSLITYWSAYETPSSATDLNVKPKASGWGERHAHQGVSITINTSTDASSASGTDTNGIPSQLSSGSNKNSTTATSAPEDGRVSPSVRWCDERGGSLTRTHVIEPTEEQEKEKAELLQALREDSKRVRSETGRRVLLEEMNRLREDDGEVQPTESPQWGWYVAITPPHDSCPQELLRAVSQPLQQYAPPQELLASARTGMRRSKSNLRQ